MKANSPLAPAEVTRRVIIRRIAARAKSLGWSWADNHGGWWLPDGQLVLVDQLFNSHSPQDFLVPLPVTVDGQFRAIEAPTEATFTALVAHEAASDSRSEIAKREDRGEQ